MSKAAKNNLGYLGTDFQYKLVSSFVRTNSLFKDLVDIIDQNMFTEVHLRNIVTVMKDYFRKYESVPSFDMIMIKLREKCYDDDETQYYEELIEKLGKDNGVGHEEIEDIAVRFFKQQNLIKVANEMLKIAGTGELERADECEKMLSDALSIGRRDDELTNPYDHVDDDLSKENIVTIPTGISKIDSSLGGGLDKGKIGLILGSSGFGKTSMTTCIAANAAAYACESNNYEGYKILQIVFEDTNRDLHRKYFSKISQVESCKINDSEETTDMVRELLNNYPDKEFIRNNIRIMKLDTGEYSALDIREKIKKVMNEGYKPDMVIVDYFECLAPERGSRNDDVWTSEGKSMRKFENMAKELDIAMWIPIQGNRESLSAGDDSKIVTMDKSGGSIKKIQIAQVVISITRSVDDTKNQKATIAILKNRGGRAGIVLNGIKFDNGTCTISCEETIEFDDSLAYNEYADEEEEKIKSKMTKGILKKK